MIHSFRIGEVGTLAFAKENYASTARHPCIRGVSFCETAGECCRDLTSGVTGILAANGWKLTQLAVSEPAGVLPILMAR